MKPPLIVSATVATLLALSACSSSDDDSDPATTPAATAGPGTEPGTDSGINPGIAEGEPNPSAPSGPNGEPSTPGPAGDPMPISDAPGGDTRAIEGFWDATSPDDFYAEHYVVVSGDGLMTEYFLLDDGQNGGNCFGYLGPQTLTPEDPAANVYGLADGRTIVATTDGSRTALSIEFVDDGGPTGGGPTGGGPAQTWPAVTGRMAGDLPVCNNF